MNFVRPLKGLPLTAGDVYLRTLIGASQALLSGTTCMEEGYNVVFQFWRGILAPSDTPEATVTELSERFEKLTQDPGFLRLIGKIGSEIQFLGHKEFAKALTAEQEALRKAYIK